MNQIRFHANLWSVSFSVFMFLLIGGTAASMNGDDPKDKTNYERLEQRLHGMTNEELRSLAKDGTVPATISDLHVSPGQLSNSLIQELARRLETPKTQTVEATDVEGTATADSKADVGDEVDDSARIIHQANERG